MTTDGGQDKQYCQVLPVVNVSLMPSNLQWGKSADAARSELSNTRDPPSRSLLETGSARGDSGKEQLGLSRRRSGRTETHAKFRRVDGQGEKRTAGSEHSKSQGREAGQSPLFFKGQ